MTWTDCSTSIHQDGRRQVNFSTKTLAISPQAGFLILINAVAGMVKQAYLSLGVKGLPLKSHLKSSLDLKIECSTLG